MSVVGFRINATFERPPKELIDGFAGLPVANIADTMNRMFCIDARIRPLNAAPLLGPAFTVRTRPGDNLLLHKAIDMAAPGDIVVVDAQGDITNSLIGELMIRWSMRRGIGGFVIDGAVRDVAFLRTLHLPIYAAGVTPAGPYKDGPGEINVAVSCGGATVHPGDILAGDQDGVVVISPADARDILHKARTKSQDEKKIVQAIDRGDYDRSWVDKALAAKGCQIIE